MLIDFGLARVRGGGAVPLGGTLTYMAPELKRGRWATPSPRTDLYALGVSLQLWAQAHPEEPLSGLVGRLAAADPAHRPVDAEEALADPVFASCGAEAPRRLGGRGLSALWGGTVTTLASALCGRVGLHRVEVPAEDDADALLTDLAAALEIGGQPALRLSADQVDGAGVALWERVVAAMTGQDEALPSPEILAPEDHKEVLDTRAVALIDALRDADQTPALLVPTPSRLSDPGRYVLARLVEAGCVSRVVATVPSGRDLVLGRGVEDAFQTTVVAPPSAETLHHFLVDHGLPPTASGEATRLLMARAAAGARALRLLLRAWATAGALSHDPAEGWFWDPEVDVAALDTPALGELWPRLWDALPDTARALVAHAHHLGGQVTLDTLAALDGGPFDRVIQTRLLEEGWCRGAADALRLQPSAQTALQAGDIALPPLSNDDRQAYVTLLGETPNAPSGLAALAHHLRALCAPALAAERFDALGAHHELHLDPGAAGAALAHAAACYDAAGDAVRAFDRAEQAVRLLQVAADEPGLTDALALAGRACGAVGTDEVALRLALLEARVAVHGTRPDEALAAAERADVLLTGLGDSGDQALRFDLALARGTAHAQAGRCEAAVEELTRSAELAAARGDDHGEGRVTNNLGIAAYNGRDYAAAAEAWARSAAAKLRTGDVRGHRISESNRGLALRELGRLPEAIAAARSSLADAQRIGDRRGEATGYLALAQLHLDVGDAAGAAEHLEACRAVPVASAMVRADSQVIGVRHRLASGDAAAAARMAANLVVDAAEAGLTTVAREAWGLTYLALTRARLRKLEAAEVHVVLTEDPATYAHALGIESDPLLAAIWLHATACKGDWPAVRPALSERVRALSAPLAPGDFCALELLRATSELVGDEVARAAIDEACELTLDARQTSARAILGAAAPSYRALAKVFGVQVEREIRPERLELGLDDTVLRHEGGPSSVPLAPVLEVALRSKFSDPAHLCEAVRELVSATTAHLVLLDDARRPVDLDGASTSARWAAVATDVLVGGERYLAAAGEEAVAALGLPLRVTPESEPVAALFLAWDEPLEAAGAEVARQLRRTCALLALSVDRRVKARELASVRARLLRLDQEHRSLVITHRDEVTALREALDQSRSDLSLRHDYSQIVHRSRQMQKVLRVVDKVADRDIPVLVLGESGVGKEVVAGAIHAHGARSGGPFIAENCGAIPDELFESVFFGHVRGAFTGADTAREGLLAAVEGGTLFLDELGELSMAHQVKLLRVLQERRYRPVGATEEREADFRLVAATNRDLQAQVADGTFREDLYYRLAVVEL
ncbi:MAG: sigma 54-interacting transcriptional regulator, partial [Myxococcota bacterium]|nr:sigma 54-interacting transcriptional regulator [Myxococcota bacterium]